MSPLKRKRVALGLTAQNFAIAVGASSSAVSYWERGVRQPHPKYYAAMARVLKISRDAVAELVEASSGNAISK